MCDYCGCRSQPEIAALSADHERLLSMTAALRRSLEAGERITRRCLDELAAVLVPHAEREEIGIFAALRDVGVDESYVARFEGDHVRIDGLLAAARSEPSAVVTLIELIEKHIFREETDMYPAARQLLDPARWDAVDLSVFRGGPRSLTFAG